MENTGRIVGIILIFAIVISGGGYIYYQNQMEEAVSKLEISLDGVDVKSFRLLPSPEANVTLIYVVNNTSNLGFSVKLDEELYYGDSYITPLSVEDTYLRANGLSNLQMDITITGAILNTIDPGKQGEYIVEGEMAAKKFVLGIPITIKKPLSDYINR